MASNYFLIVRQLQSKYPEVYNDIVGNSQLSKKYDLEQILERFCSIRKCTKDQIKRNEDGVRTLFVAVLVKMVDPIGVGDNGEIRRGLLAEVSRLIDVSHIMTRQVACNVKGLLRAHKPFIREVDRIIGEINGNEEE